MTTRRVRLAIVLVAAATLALAGCAPAVSTPTTQPTSAATATPTPTPTTPALDTTAPAAQVATQCGTLLTTQQVTAWQGPGVTLVAAADDAAGDLADPRMQIPASDYIRAAGGLYCLWSAGPVDHYTTSNAAPSYLEVTVQFDATAEYNQNADLMGAINGRAGECDVDDPGSVCLIDDLVNGAWIQLLSRHAVGHGSTNGIETIENAVDTEIKADVPSGVPAPQSGTIALGAQCAAFASTSAVQSALGISAAVTASTPSQSQAPGDDPQTPIWFPSQDALKDHPCVFSAGGKTQAQVSWIPGGAWAWNENDTQALAEAPLHNLQLTGEGPHDTASLRCNTSVTTCTVDLVLGGNWIEVTVPATSTATDRTDAATKIAQAIVTTVG